MRNSNLRVKFGITENDYQRILMSQGGVCAICGQEDSKRLAVDHDHLSRRIRGLLCQSCNNGLGRFKDNPDLLRKAAEYVS